MENTTTLLQVFRESEHSAIELVLQWEERAAAFKEDLLKTDLPSFKAENVHEFVYYLASVYKATAFFGDPEVKSRLVEAGLKVLHHRWFIDLKAVLKEIRAINLSGEAFLLPYETLLTIKLHLDTKINVEIQTLEGLTRPFNDKKYTTKIKADLYNLYRRRDPNSSALKRPKGAYDQAMNELILEAEKQIADKEVARRMFLKLSEGNTKEFMLNSIVKSSLIATKTDTFYSTFFPLFSLINPDKEWMSEEEFYAQSRYTSKSYQGYQAKRVRDLIK